MLSQSLDGLQWKMLEKLNIPAAYGPVLRKLQTAIFFLQFLADRHKKWQPVSDYDILYKVSMNRMKIGREQSFKKIVKLEILQSALNDSKPNSRNRPSKVPYICAL